MTIEEKLEMMEEYGYNYDEYSSDGENFCFRGVSGVGQYLTEEEIDFFLEEVV